MTFVTFGTVGDSKGRRSNPASRSAARFDTLTASSRASGCSEPLKPSFPEGYLATNPEKGHPQNFSGSSSLDFWLVGGSPLFSTKVRKIDTLPFGYSDVEGFHKSRCLSSLDDFGFPALFRSQLWASLFQGQRYPLQFATILGFTSLFSDPFLLPLPGSKGEDWEPALVRC